MNLPANPKLKSAPALLSWLLGACIIFLQVGFTYYWSFQTLAVLLVLLVVLQSRPAFVNLGFVLLIMVVFTAFLGLTAFTVPIAISENSANLFNTFVGVVGYAFMIACLPNLAFRSPEVVLRFFRFVATLTILMIVALICITDLEVFPFLTRETLILQNTTLITNYTTLDVLDEDFKYLHDNGLQSTLVLFYGEQSFLAAVLFSSVVSRLVCDKLLVKKGWVEPVPQRVHKASGLSAFVKRHAQAIVAVLGLGAMIYIKSFSSFFYVVIICASLMMSPRRRIAAVRLKPGTLLLALLGLVLLGSIAVSASEYYTHRFTTVSDSVSFDQRFASALDFGLQEYILGIGDVAKMPKVGFQNGILYIVAISGVGGLGLMALLFYRIHVLARPLGLSIVAMACVFGTFSQNGGILSPNKVVILSLVLLPLACGNHIRRRRRESREAQLALAGSGV